MTTEEVTAQAVKQVQAEHIANIHLSAVTIGERLSLDLSPVMMVQIIEGKFNHLLETDQLIPQDLHSLWSLNTDFVA